jgi:predicted DNA-binding mobile mystery protein A
MQATADAMGCRFVYAVVPAGTVDEVVAARARKKAMALVATASQHMALEGQLLSDERNALELDRLTRDLISTMPPDFWDGG